MTNEGAPMSTSKEKRQQFFRALPFWGPVVGSGAVALAINYSHAWSAAAYVGLEPWQATALGAVPELLILAATAELVRTSAAGKAAQRLLPAALLTVGIGMSGAINVGMALVKAGDLPGVPPWAVVLLWVAPTLISALIWPLAEVRARAVRRPAVEVPTEVNIDPRRSPEAAELAPVFTEPRGGGVVPAEEPTTTISDDWPPYGQWPKGEAGMRHARRRIAEYAREHGVLIPSGVLSDESGYPHDQQVRRARCPECRPQWLADELAAAGVTGEKASAAVCGGCRTKARRAS